MKRNETHALDVLPRPAGRKCREGRVHDARAQRSAIFGAEPARCEPVRAVRLEEHVRVAQERAQRLRVCGGVQVELGRALAARRLYVEEGYRRQVRGRHEEDIGAVRW
jgi:hypothetical protein